MYCNYCKPSQLLQILHRPPLLRPYDLSPDMNTTLNEQHVAVETHRALWISRLETNPVRVEVLRMFYGADYRVRVPSGLRSLTMRCLLRLGNCLRNSHLRN